MLYDVFLSHSEADKTPVEVIGRRLQQETGLRPFLDRWHLIPGQPVQEALEAALQQSETAAVFIGAAGISPWHNEEMRVALDNAVRTRDEYRVIPVLLPGAAEAGLPGFLARRFWVDFRGGLDDDAAFARLVAGIRGQPPEEIGLFALPDEPAPYPGLLPFKSAQAQFFFGRTAERAQLLARVRASPFVAVIGASGSGKSSLVLAGLLPALDRDWQTLVLAPGAHPLRALAEALATLVPLESRLRMADELEARLADRPDGLRTAVPALLAGRSDTGKLLLVVDQFEELFTLASDAGPEARRQQDRFIANLVNAVQESALYVQDSALYVSDASALPGTPSRSLVQVVLTLRADFMHRCLDYPELRGLLETNQFLLGPLGEDGLREAIVKPAQVVGAICERGLVGRLLAEMAGQPAALPLLQFTLAQMWTRRQGVWLTHAAYEAIGGVAGALDRRAEGIFGRLSESQQRLAHHLFLRLVALGEGTGDTRRRIRRDELELVGFAPQEVQQLVDILAHREIRLISTEADNIELAHEALIERWGRLRDWLAEDRTGQQTHRRLTEAAAEWEGHGREASYLYRGARLRTGQSWARAHPDRLSRQEWAFLAASSSLHRHERLKSAALIAPLPLLIALALVAALLRIDVVPTALSEWLPAAGWSAAAGETGQYAVAVLADPLAPELVYAADRSRGGVYRSADGGRSWQKISAAILADKVVRVMAAGRDGVIYAMTSDGVFAGRERGQSWEALRSLPPGPRPDIWAIAVAPDDPRRLYLGIWHDGIWTTADGGGSWLPAVKLAQLNDSHLVRALAVAATAVYAATERGLFASTDTGRSWAAVPIADKMGQAAILTLAVGPAGRLLAGTRGQGVWQQQGSALYVTEGGWVALTRPGGPEAFAFSVSQAGDVLYVGSSAGGIVQQRIWHWWQRDRWVSRPRGGPAEGPVLAPAGPALVRVPAGEFEMGRPEAGQLVYVEGFWIDRFEVTWEVYCRQQVTDPACGSLTPETGALPATDLLWDEANAFCKAVGRQLPTGAQWEKAARGPDGRPYPWGDEAPKPDFANIFTGSIRIDPGTPEPMLEGIPPLLPPGSRPQGHSPYGAEDLAGNVWELIADGDSHRRPQNRGGAHTTRLTEELFINPEPYAVPTGDDLGFRCVRP